MRQDRLPQPDRDAVVRSMGEWRTRRLLLQPFAHPGQQIEAIAPRSTLVAGDGHPMARDLPGDDAFVKVFFQPGEDPTVVVGNQIG